ncbi:hypothetical protein [Aurantiacibacter luteus]|uniref:Lipoprotein n=1 Tax=Aurantiacibacter luteus TaxID=1581420 RepID=A0A0G9MVT8_9SPHN|nr:hypothetical protein [Aurantiacibacter luteus]KLE34825.1 hypothetical protein AAW00_07560 [Aurantiacibacter luteus]
MPALPRLLAALLPAALAGCATTAPALAPPQEVFWQALSSHCGHAYEGALVSTQAADADMAGRPMAMHVRTCSDTRIEVPFHVAQADGAWDRSRTWIFTRTPAGLRLKHDHRHADGSADVLTMYGGDTAAPGTSRAQDFPVDGESVALFLREERAVSVTNVWRVEVDAAGTPGARFAYQLSRPAPDGRLFRVEFDAARPVLPPPAPWGW